MMELNLSKTGLLWDWWRYGGIAETAEAGLGRKDRERFDFYRWHCEKR